MPVMRDVVITGTGVVSPIGIGNDAFWDGLAAGRSGVGPISLFDASGLPVGFGGEIREFDPKRHVRPRKSLKVMSREIQFGFAAADQALTAAGIAPGTVDPDRFGVLFGADLIYDDIHDLEAVFRSCRHDGRFDFDRWAEAAMAEMYPLWLLKQLPNMIASHVAIFHDARGPNNTLVIGDVSAVMALAEAASVIRRGLADVMLVGGTGSRLHPGAMVLRGDALLSHRSADAAAASRPFERDRDGMVNGEGAAAFVFESADHASRRGAKVLARLGAAVGRCEKRRGIGVPLTGTAMAAAIDAAVGAAGIAPADVGHVNAHGLSTIAEDRVEAEVIRARLGDVAVTAPKSFFGNAGAGGAAMELAASLIGLGRGLIPPTLNYDSADPACPVRVVYGGPMTAGDGAILKLSAARTGQVAAAVLLPPE
ncbi:MAG: beta-ketoacyl-[acyl-carrier-protein] synthase family protein [Planctomycetia bacterium]|nr:beta-ketoacyl-[acyl-carrier-protein] synthase family protein [Planctomycetia bacterium]